MELKRYVQVENGMVYENQTAIFDNVSKGLYHYQELKIGDELPLKPLLCLKKYGSDYTKITATADDIFELVADGWIVEYHGKKQFVFKNEKNINGKSDNLWLEETGESEYITSPWYANILALYCPITENGQVVRYERVWERGKGE